MTIYSEGINEVASVNTGSNPFTLTSTTEEKKKLLRVFVTDVDTFAVLLGIDLEREHIMENVPLEMVNDLTPPRVFEVDMEIPVGQTAKAVLKPQVDGDQGTIDGWMEYEIIG